MSDDNRRPEEIQDDIERTRADLSETVDTIQQKVSPENLKNQVIHQASDAIEDIKEAVIGKLDELLHGVGGGVENLGANLTERIKENPVPAALIGVGISWLVMSASKSGQQRPLRNEMRYASDQQYDYRSSQGYTGAGGLQSVGRQETGGMGQRADSLKGRAQDLGEEAKGRAQGWAEEAKGRAQGSLEGARERAEGMADTARDRFEDMSERAQGWAEGAQQGMHQAEEGLQRMMRENPLAVGAVALALGAAIGLAVPSTRQEDTLMGAARDQMVDRAKDVADRVKHVAQATAQDVMDTAKGEAQREGLRPEAAAAGAEGALHGADRKVDKAMDSARQAASEAIDKGKDVVEKAADATKRVAESAKETAKEEAKKQDL